MRLEKGANLCIQQQVIRGHINTESLQYDGSNRFSPTTFDLSSLGSNVFARYGLHPVKQAVNPVIKQLVTHITFKPLLHQWAYLVRTVIIVALLVHMYSTFQYYESWPVGRKLQGQYQIDFSVCSMTHLVLYWILRHFLDFKIATL